jgi:hypothetical protein
VPRRKRKRRSYTLSGKGEPVTITGWRKRNLSLAMEREISEGLTEETSITSHPGGFYFGHWLRQDHTIVYRVPESRSNVRFFFSLEHVPPTDLTNSLHY